MHTPSKAAFTKCLALTAAASNDDTITKSPICVFIAMN